MPRLRNGFYAGTTVGFQTFLLRLGSWTCRIPVSASGAPESQAYGSQRPIGRTLGFPDRVALGFQDCRTGLGSHLPTRSASSMNPHA